MWKSIRKLFNDIHLYAGLISGLIVIAVCLSGTIYVYNTEIREFFDSERYFVRQDGTPQSLDQLKAQLATQVEGQIVGVNISNELGRSVQFSVKKEGEGRPATLFVDPYSGQILADNQEKTATEEFMGYVFSPPLAAIGQDRRTDFRKHDQSGIRTLYQRRCYPAFFVGGDHRHSYLGTTKSQKLEARPKSKMVWQLEACQSRPAQYPCILFPDCTVYHGRDRSILVLSMVSHRLAKNLGHLSTS